MFAVLLGSEAALTSPEPDCRWVRGTEVLWRGTAGFLSLARVDGFHVEVTGPGWDVWRILERPVTLDQLVDALYESYGGSRSQIELDMQMLIEKLASDDFVARVA